MLPSVQVDFRMKIIMNSIISTHVQPTENLLFSKEKVEEGSI